MCVWNFAVAGSPNVEFLGYSNVESYEFLMKRSPRACGYTGHLGHVVRAAGTGTAILVLWLWIGLLRLIWGLGTRWSYYLQISSSGVRSSVGSCGLGTMPAWRGSGSGNDCRATCPISFHFMTTELHCIWGKMMTFFICCIYILTINIFRVCYTDKADIWLVNHITQTDVKYNLYNDVCILNWLSVASYSGPLFTKR